MTVKVNYYPPNTYVRVVLPRDPCPGHVGIVDHTFNDGGDMVHKVVFRDGNSAYYQADEITDIRNHRHHVNRRSAT